MVEASRCDASDRVQRSEREVRAPDAPLDAPRTAQRAIPTTPIQDLVEASRCDVADRVQRSEREAGPPDAPLDAARTAQRAVPTTV